MANVGPRSDPQMQENTAQASDNIQQTRSFKTLLIKTGIYVITIPVWYFVQLIVFMAILDSSGPTITNVPGYIALLLASAYLYVTTIAVIIAWFLYYTGSYRNASRVSLIPVANILLMIVAFGLFLVSH